MIEKGTSKMVAALLDFAIDAGEFDHLTVATLGETPLVGLTLRTRAAVHVLRQRLLDAGATETRELKTRSNNGSEWIDVGVLHRGVMIELSSQIEQLSLFSAGCT